MTEASSSRNAQQQMSIIESSIFQRTTDISKFLEMPMEGQEDFLKNKAKQAESAKKGLIRIVNTKRSVSVHGEDPVGSHLIELREHALALETLISKASELKNAKRQPPNPSKVEKLKPAPPIPPFPEKYPFVDSLEKSAKDSDKKILTYDVRPSKKAVDGDIFKFAMKVLKQTGYHDCEDFMLDNLVEAARDFLENFVLILRRYKNSPVFIDSEDLMKPLEITLRAIGFNGIRGLHDYYYYDLATKHDVMLKQCVTLHEEYDKLLGELKGVRRKPKKKRIAKNKGETLQQEEIYLESME